ncbi:MAG TPA: capsule assembly Wzi family protein, partial [Longimicrobiales bacterium]|nr:capsule assembly Wzi family protein [Longimicrobiales bacterium]
MHAIDRLHAMGLAVPGTVRGESSRSVSEALAVFRNAASSGHEGAREYLRRFEMEFSSDSTGGVVLTHASGAVGAGALDGDVAHGIYSIWGEENWTGARPREDRTTATGRGALLAGLGEYLAAGAVASGGPLRTRLDELYGVARLGPVGVWGGRRIQGFGPGTSGMVLSGAVPVDGAGVHVGPIRLPSFLRHLGPVRGDITVGLSDANGPVERPWFILTRGSIEPHPRVGFGVTRGGMIGAVDEHVSVVDVLLFLAGDHTDGSEYDNQIAAVDAWFRPPVGMPLLLYIEWGAEDSAGSWWDVPGIIVGAELPSLPALPWLSLLVERTSLERSNSGNPPWYRH